MRRLPIVLGTFLVCLPAPPALAGPQAGKRYDGRTSADRHAFFVVSRDGQRFADYDIPLRLECSNGRRRSVVFDPTGERPTPIASTARATRSVAPSAYATRLVA